MNELRRFRLDQRAIVRSFNRASAAYDLAARLQTQVSAELLERLQFFQVKPGVILDLGCGTGLGAAALRRRFRRAQVCALDAAFAMTQRARQRQRFWRRYACICADGIALPLRAQSVDLVFSSLMLQWCDDLPAVFAEVQRVLRPGGLLLFSTFGPDTLQELRAAWAAADQGSHVSQFADMPLLGEAMAHAGLAEPVMDRELKRDHHGEVRELLTQLRSIGARHAAEDRRRGLTGRGRWRAMLDAYEKLRTPAGLPATWEVIYGAAFAGQTRSGSDVDRREVIVPLSAVRRGRGAPG